MKARTLVIASALLAASAGFAVAQNTGSPANPSRPGMQGDDSSKPNGLQNNAGTGLPAKAGTSDTKSSDTIKRSPATTGSGTKRSTDTNVSPASPNASEQQPAK